MPPPARFHPASRIEPLESRIAPAVTVVFDLSRLNGSDGFKVQGTQASGAGRSVSDAGDVNGDGFADLIISEIQPADLPPLTFTGSSYVVFGHGDGFPGTLDLTTLDGSNGFRIRGEAAHDYAGLSVSAAGDVNGDGFSDLIIGAPGGSGNGLTPEVPGAAYVVFGKASGFTPELALSSLDGTNGFKIPGLSQGSLTGLSVSGGGDANGDGLADVIIGAPQAANLKGETYVIFGSRLAFAPCFDLATLDGANGFVVASKVFFQNAGRSVTSAGDLNGDGVADVLIGTGTTQDTTGNAYVVFGKPGARAPRLELSSLDGTNGFAIYGESTVFAAGNGTVGSGGDINGDGFADLLIGAPESTFQGFNSGITYVVFGKAAGYEPVLELADLDGSNGFSVRGAGPGARSGASVSSAGDVNGDGFADVLIGAPGSADGHTQAAYLLAGAATGFPATVTFDSLDGRNGFKIPGLSRFDGLGGSVSTAGDVNGDHLADFVIGASGSSSSYVVFGRTDMFVEPYTETAANVRFREPDGDLVTVGLSKGKIAQEELVLRIGDGGLRLGRLDLGGAGVNRGAKVSIAAPGGSAEVGLVTVEAGARIPELRIEGDLTALQVLDRLEPQEFGAYKVIPAGTLGLVHAGSLGLRQELFPALAAEVSFDRQAGRLEWEGAVSASSLRFGGGAEHVKVGGDWIDSTLHTQGLLKRLEIGGSMRGAVLTGLGPAQPANAAATVVFGSITIGGNLEHSQVLAGYEISQSPSRGASIGSVLVKGNLTASDLVAGATPGRDLMFGTKDDLAIADDDVPLAKIGAVTVLGTAIDANPPAATHGIVAEALGPVRIHGAAVALAKGPQNDLEPMLLPGSAEERVREVSAAVVVKLNLSNLDDSTGFRFEGISDSIAIGDRVSGAGDVNGDGLADVLIGGQAASVIFGTAQGFQRPLSLSTLDGANGFRIVSETPFVGLAAVSEGGDVNGDGFGDLLVASGGRCYVIFGRPNGFAAELNLGSLDGSNGFAIDRTGPNEAAGISLSSAGDVNGDGFDDLVIGAEDNGSGSGGAYVIFGKPSGFAAALALSSLDGTNGFKLSGAANQSRAGASVSGAGDVNGDGFADLLIGSPQLDQRNYRGAAYVIFGKKDGFGAVLDFTKLDGSNGFNVQGEEESDQLGISLSGAGDVNGDGFGDFLLGADRHDALFHTQRGVSYLVFGKGSGFGGSLDLASLDGSNGFKLLGAATDDRAGANVSGAGDVNGDGLADMLVGAYGAGVAYLVFGKTVGFTPALSLSTLDGSNGFVIRQDGPYASTGAGVSGAGDVNGDGFADLLVGSPDVFSGRVRIGAAHVVYGTPAVQVDDRTVAYTEADGDRVVIQANHGTLTTGALQFTEVSANRYVANTLDLRVDNLQGADVTVQVVSADGASLRQGGPAPRALTGNVGIPNIGTVILPDVGGPLNLDIAGNVQQVSIPAAAKLKSFRVLSLGADSDLFPAIPRQFNGAGTIVKLTVEGDVTDYTFDVPGAVDQMIVGGKVAGSTLTFAKKLQSFIVKGDLEASTVSFAAGAGLLRVDGNIHGTAIAAQGALQPRTPAQALALAKLVVKGDVADSQILAGYDAALLPTNADAQIGLVNIGGVLRASSLVAGATRGPDLLFGTGDDELLASGRPVVSKIASIIVAAVEGTVLGGDSFGIVAEEIGSLKIGGAAFVLTRRAGNDLTPLPLLADGGTADFFVREVVGP